MSPHLHADKKHHHGNPSDLDGYIKKMEDPERAVWQKPDEVIRALALKKGQTVCDIGVGPGYFAIPIARAVGDTGRVWAVDVEPKMLTTLRERMATAKVGNVTPVLAHDDDPLLPDGVCDLILIVDTYHHFPDGVAYLKRLGRALAPNGRLVNIDFHKRELPVGPPLDHKVARESFIENAAQAGWLLAQEPSFLPYQYFLIFRKRK